MGQHWNDKVEPIDSEKGKMKAFWELFDAGKVSQYINLKKVPESMDVANVSHYINTIGQKNIISTFV